MSQPMSECAHSQSVYTFISGILQRRAAKQTSLQSAARAYRSGSARDMIGSGTLITAAIVL